LEELKPTNRWIVNGFDITDYAPPPHGEEVAKQTAFIQDYFESRGPTLLDTFMRVRAPGTPLTSAMLLQACNEWGLDKPGLYLMMALMQFDSMYGTLGEGARLHNPGNIGDDDLGNTVDYVTWQNGVNAVAEWLHRHRVIME